MYESGYTLTYVRFETSVDSYYIHLHVVKSKVTLNINLRVNNHISYYLFIFNKYDMLTFTAMPVSVG